MLRLVKGGALVAIMCAIGAIGWTAPAAAQSAGIMRGLVVDGDGNPVVGAQIRIQTLTTPRQTINTETDENGRFREMGLRATQYEIEAQKEGVGGQLLQVTVREGQVLELNFDLGAAAAAGLAGLSEEDLANVERIEGLKEAFGAGVAASNAGNHEEAVAQFREAIGILDTCFDCYHNMGLAYTQLGDFDEAEAAFKQAIVIKPDYAASYTGLANIYNTQRRFDEAAEASAEAARLSAPVAGGGATDPVNIFNQGIIYWNAANIPAAKEQFQQVLELDPSHAEANYWLAMANLNEGNLADAASGLERYLELDPSGQYADQARGMLTQLRP